MTAAAKIRRPKPLTETEIYEHRVMDNAVAWTAFVQVHPFDRRRREGATLEEALELAKPLLADTGRKIMIYAIDAEGHDCMVGFVDLNGAFKSATAPRR